MDESFWDALWLGLWTFEVLTPVFLHFSFFQVGFRHCHHIHSMRYAICHHNNKSAPSAMPCGPSYGQFSISMETIIGKTNIVFYWLGNDFWCFLCLSWWHYGSKFAQVCPSWRHVGSSRLQVDRKSAQIGSKTAQVEPRCGHARQILVSLQDFHYFLGRDTQRHSGK